MPATENFKWGRDQWDVSPWTGILVEYVSNDKQKCWTAHLLLSFSFFSGNYWGITGSPKTPCTALVPDPDIGTCPIVCVSIHVGTQEADVNTQECVIPFLMASRPL